MSISNKERHSSRDLVTQPRDMRHSWSITSSSLPSDRHPERNEDSLVIDRRRCLAAVFDGVGGKDDGHIASQAAAQYLLQTWKDLFKASHQPMEQATYRLSDMHALLGNVIQGLEEEIKKAGRRYAQSKGISPETYRCPATTAAFVVGCQDEEQCASTMMYGHIGDCRIYLLRNGEPLQRLTEDDGLLSLLIQEGKLSRDDAVRIDQATASSQLDEMEQSYYYRRNKITQALGWAGPLEPHIQHLTLLPGDRILLCTDGVHDNVTDQEIETALKLRSRTGSAKTVVQRAYRSSHQEKGTNFRAKADDMSAIVITYQVSQEK